MLGFTDASNSKILPLDAAAVDGVVIVAGGVTGDDWTGADGETSS